MSIWSSVDLQASTKLGEIEEKEGLLLFAQLIL